MTQKDRSRQSESVRSVERAIELLEALNRSPLSTIGELHRQTGIPKSSIVRLLRALETEGLVTQTATYSAYRLLGQVTSLSNGFPQEPPIIEIAEPLMIEFTKREGWPVGLALFDRDAMVVSASTIPYTSLAPVQSSLGVRLSLIGYAHGQAYLAHVSPNRQKSLIETIAQSTDPVDAPARDPRALRQMLKQVHERGYALRNQLLLPQSSSLAIPVYEKGRVVASLGLTWIAAAIPLQKALAQYVPQILAMGETISRALDRQSLETARSLSRSDWPGEQRTESSRPAV